MRASLEFAPPPRDLDALEAEYGELFGGDDKKKRPPKPTDDELGEAFLSRHREHYAFFYGTWHQWERGLWAPSEREHLRAAWKVAIDRKADGIRPSAHLANSILEYASLYLFASDNQLAAGGDYINLENGMYNLKTGDLEEHRKELYFTSQLPFNFDPSADCPNWKRFLMSVLQNERGVWDDELEAVIQEGFGYSLTADTGHRTSFWLVGPSGTGKSTLLNMLIALAGDSHVTIDLDLLNRNEYQLADLPGKRVVTFTEPAAGTVLADGHYKRIVSQDTITGRSPYGKPFRFVPVCKVWGAMNETPRVTDRSDAVFSRVQIIPMTRVVPASERDGQLTAKLIGELPGIFNWALEGLARLNSQRSFTRAKQVQAARDEFRAENDSEAAFLEACTKRGPGGTVKSSELYQTYKWWCEANGFRPKSSTKVAKDWTRLGLSKKHSNGVFYLDITLRPDSERG